MKAQELKSLLTRNKDEFLIRQLCGLQNKAARNIIWLRLLFHPSGLFLMYWLTRTPQLHLCIMAPPTCLPAGPPKPAHRKGEGEVEPNEEER